MLLCFFEFFINKLCGNNNLTYRNDEKLCELLQNFEQNKEEV